MIKPVDINSGVRFGSLGNIKNGHADKNISSNVVKNEVAEAKEKPLLLASYIQPTNRVSFKSSILKEAPEDWVLQNDGVVEKYGVTADIFPLDTTQDEYPQAKAVFDQKEVRGKLFPFYETREEQTEDSSTPTHKKPYRNGFVYVHDDGAVTRLKYDFSSPASEGFKNATPNLSDSKYIPSEKQYLAIIEACGTSKEGIAHKNHILEKHTFADPELQSMQLDYLVGAGRAEEAIELFPDQAEKVAKLESLYLKENLIVLDDEPQDEFDSMILAGDIDGIFKNYDKYSKRLPDSVRRLDWKEQKEVAAILKNDAFIEEYHYQAKKQAKDDAMTEALAGPMPKFDRVMAALFSFGATELVYNYTYHTNFMVDVSISKRKKIEAITDLADMIISRREENNKNIKDREVQILSSEEKQADVKGKLRKVLLYPIERYKDNNAVFVPNSVMLQGDNPCIMKDIISSMSTKPFVNFVSVPSKRNYDEMQDEIFDQLELAEQKYQETKERSIIFVNGMEKLLNPELNSAGNIACMKDILSCASEDYHSTIVFYAQNPENLDKGSLMTHRVAYKIDVPFSAVQVKD